MALSSIDPRMILGSYFANKVRGCILSYVNTTTIGISAGYGWDSDGDHSFSIGAFTKTTSAWAAGTGNGGLDTGAIATSTWYHFYVISNPLTNTVDVIFSLNAVSPTMPTGYTEYVYIGQALTDGSSHWTQFIAYEIGNGMIEYNWYVPVQAYTVSSSGTSAITATLTGCPTGIKVKWTGSVEIVNSVGYWLLTSLDQADTIPSSSVFTLVANSSTPLTSEVAVITNTSAQVRHRISSSASTITFISKGWIHFRV